MKAPKCPVCGVSEWRHLCGNVVIAATPTAIRGLKERLREHFDVKPTALQIGVTKKNKVTKNKVTKRGRPKLGEVSLTAAEKMRRYREKKKEKAGE